LQTQNQTNILFLILYFSLKKHDYELYIFYIKNKHTSKNIFDKKLTKIRILHAAFLIFEIILKIPITKLHFLNVEFILNFEQYFYLNLRVGPLPMTTPLYIVNSPAR